MLSSLKMKLNLYFRKFMLKREHTSKYRSVTEICVVELIKNKAYLISIDQHDKLEMENIVVRYLVFANQKPIRYGNDFDILYLEQAAKNQDKDYVKYIRKASFTIDGPWCHKEYLKLTINIPNYIKCESINESDLPKNHRPEIIHKVYGYV